MGSSSADLPDRSQPNRAGRRFAPRLRGLFGEAWERTQRRRRRQLWSFAALCALAIVVGLVLHGSGGASGGPSAGSGRLGSRVSETPTIETSGQAPLSQPAPPLGSVPNLAQLEANFAILRRPQTTADRSFTPVCSCAHSPDPSTRLAGRLPGGYRVFVDLESYRGAINFPDLMLYIVSPNGNTSAQGIDAGGYLVNPTFWGIRNSTDVKLFASAVPDGVASVSWTFNDKTYAVPVHHNLAAREIRGNWNGASGSSPTKVVWHAPDGRIILTLSGFAGLAAPPFLAGKVGNGTDHVLAGGGIGSAHLGEPTAKATRSLTRLLGAPADSNVRVASCGVDHETVWTSPAVAAPLTTYSRNGRFIGYEYGVPADSTGVTREPGAVLATQHGVTISDRFAAVTRAYNHTATRTINGVGSWSAPTTNGELHGYVLAISSRYPLRSVTANNPVATIGAGNTGCRPTKP